MLRNIDPEQVKGLYVNNQIRVIFDFYKLYKLKSLFEYVK